MSYYYKVRVSRVGTAKEPSLYSAVAAALAPPNTPVTPKTISYPYTVTLTWKKAKGASGYDVFYSSSPLGPFEFLGNEIYQDKKNGTQPLFVCDYALLIDDTSDEYNKLLEFSSSSLRKKGYQEIKPGKTGTVTFKLYSGAATRYNQFSRIAFIAGYDWELYLCMSSYFYGDTWSLVEW